MLLSQLFLFPLVCFAAIIPRQPNANRHALRNENHWVTILATAPARTLDSPASPYLPPPGFNTTQGILVNATVRETFRVSHGASQIRVRVTNVYGSETLDVTSMTVAIPSPNLPGSSAIDISSLKGVTFNGDSTVAVPPGADWTSDPVDFPVVAGCEVTVSTFSESGIIGTGTHHSLAVNSAFYVLGDATGQADISGPGVATDNSSYYVFAIEGYVPRSTNVIATIGDSITDGYESTVNGNKRYPDQLLDRLIASPSSGDFALVNLGISGNRVLRNGGLFGDSLLARLDHDVFSILGVTHLVIFEGTNDIGFSFMLNETVTAQDIIKGLGQVAQAAHIRGIATIGGTITPRAEPSELITPEVQAMQAAQELLITPVNDWIRNSGTFDYVVDFDVALRNESYPAQMQTALQSGDWLHPNDAGYAVMAAAFDLSVFGSLLGNVNDYN